jgi:D-glycerate 3-kinase
VSSRVTASLDIVAPAIAGWLNAAGPLVVGICGSQGSGKSTLSRHLAERFADQGVRVAVLSLDDLYLSREARQRLAETVHPMFATRGVPGTHDVATGKTVLGVMKAGQPVRLPRFDKAGDQPAPEGEWPLIARADLILFEGWCVGATPQADYELREPVNDLEATLDERGIWRRYVNDALKGPYKGLFSQMDRLIFLAAPDFTVVSDWRTQAEHDLRDQLRREGRKGTRVMTDAEVARFVLHYERLTRHILRDMPDRADLTLWLDAGRRVVRTTTSAG